MSRSSQWPLEPGHRVGAFYLGMGVNKALSIVQNMGSLDCADFSFDEQQPFSVDLTLRLPSWGIQLCFDAYQQDLRLISVRLEEGEARDAREARPELIYSGQKLTASSLREVYQTFGPTWIGDFQHEPAAYLLRYPGLAFEFPLPADMVEDLAKKGEHPMELAQNASLLWVFAAQASERSPCSAVPDLLEAVRVLPGVGAQLQGRTLRFGAMPQDVVSDFGPPQQVCIKDVDAFRIHSARAAPSKSLDYYYNYFYYGLDALFDGQTHLLQKIVLHLNPPTHERFSRYTRCFFQLLLEDEDEATALGDAILADDASEQQQQPSGRASVDVRWHWSDIEEALCRVGGLTKSKPFVMDQQGYTSFGKTYFYGFPGLVFEVMQNGYLASLTLFAVQACRLPAAFQRRETA